MAGSPKCSAGAVPGLVDDAFVEVLSRVPPKPLFRSKCVSKPWRDLISDLVSCKYLSRTLEGFFHGSGGRDNYGHCTGLSGRSVPHVDASFSFLTKLPGIEKIALLGSCNGLLLFGHRQSSDTYDSLGYIVCNPVTEQWVAVPSSGWTPFHPLDEDSDFEDLDPDGVSTYLIFDPDVSLHFHLVQLSWGAMFSLDQVKTYSSETGVWKPSEEDHEQEDWSVFGMLDDVGCLFNGLLHLLFHHPNSWIADDDDQSNSSIFNEDDGGAYMKGMIVAVDTERKISRIIHWPQQQHGDLAFVGPSQGYLHSVGGHTAPSTSKMAELSIWVLEDYNSETWVLKDTVSILQLFGRMSCELYFDFTVAGIHPDRNLVFFLLVQDSNKKLISYDMDSKEVCAVCTLVRGYGLLATLYVPYFSSLPVLNK